MLKKTLAVILAVITMFSCFGMISGAESVKTQTGLADSVNPQVKFYVPETVYLDTSDRLTFKYIYGSDTDGVAVKDETSNLIYFDGLNCAPESVKITAMAAAADNSEDYTAVDSSALASVTVGGTVFTGAEAAETGISSQSFPLSATLDAGKLASAVAAGAYRFIRWQADYVVNGLTYTTYAYSICYSHNSNYGYLRQNSRQYTSSMKSSARIQADMEIDGLNGGTVSAEQGSRDYAKSSDNSGGTLSRSTTFIVDASRFTNYSKIPYLTARDRILLNNGDSNGYTNLSAWTVADKSKTVTTSNIRNENWWQSLTLNLPTDGSQLVVYMHAHTRYNGKDVDNYTYLYINPTNVDKTQLQKEYYGAVSAARQSSWYSEGFDEYQNSILSAAVAVGNPVAKDVDKTINTDVLVYNKYNVTFINYDGTELSTQSVDFGSYAAVPEISTKPDRYDDDYHYSFTGWDKDVTAPITGDIVFTAQYGATAHNYNELVETVKEANCAQTGKAVYMCVCSKTATLDTPINPDNHDLIHHDAKAATCTEKGWNAYDTCSRCDYTTFTATDTVAHTPGEPKIENKVDATCETAGSYDEVVYCTECGTELSRNTKTIDALGHDLVHHEAKMATCTESGWYEYDTCSRCDYTTYVVMDKIAHTPGEAKIENKVDATCETAGSYDKVIYCTECGAELSREAETVEALGHDLVHHEAKTATCTESGWYAYDTCSRCDYSTYRVMEKVAHTPGEAKIENKVDATCETAGSYDDVVYCTECGTELSRNTKTIDALGHDLVECEAKAPTCSSIGWNAYSYCTRCDYTTYEELPIDENAHKYGEWIVDTQPSCFTEGSEHRVCEYNDSHIETSSIDATGRHTWNDGVVTVDPTCSSEGKKLYTCTVCNETKTEDIPVDPDAHKYGEWIVVTPATCLDNGEMRKVCEYDESHFVTESIPAYGQHDFNTVMSKEPTCTEDGYESYLECNRCGYIENYNKIDKLGHDFSVLVEHKDSDCANKGYDIYKCSRCDETMKTEYALTEHTWDNGKITKEPTVDNPGEKVYTCAACGATKTVKLYACSHCDEIFEGDDAYNKHQKDIEGLCPYCGYNHDKYLEHMNFIKLRCFLTRLFKLIFGWFKDMGAIAKR